MMTMGARMKEEIAHRHGFNSFAELLAISNPLPKKPGDEFQCYIAHHDDKGYWFIWDDRLQQNEPVAGDLN